MAAPCIALTPGEPAGIGPDVLLAAAQRDWPAALVAIADPQLLAKRAEQLGLAIELTEYRGGETTLHRPGCLPVLPTGLAADVVPGELNSANARYVLEALDRAVDGCLSGEFSAMVTGPVQKSIINAGGVPFSGHTEYLAERCATEQVVMMLAAEALRVALVTTHLPLSSVPTAINAELLASVLEIIHRDFQSKYGIDSPAIAVLGLNPHAGEDGHLGSEERDFIIPCLEQLRAAGMNLRGPLPADTAFNADTLAWADVFLAMYHDQGLPVLKYAGFGSAINITLGLPIVRTSVDHGTALPLAGSGDAKAGSMIAAINEALALSKS
ncbi:MAG: 4-hydroxythreonine-4-phosphate dehydrogenase PdxA [Pseudomonadota bacterium]